MDKEKLKKHLPTVTGYIEKRKKAKQNQLPKHLRPPVVWPIGVHLVLNGGLIVTLFNLMIDRDDYMTEAGPAVILVICFLLLIYTLINAVSLRRFHDKTRGRKLAKLNFAMMVIAFLCWAGSIVAFIP